MSGSGRIGSTLLTFPDYHFSRELKWIRLINITGNYDLN